MMSPASSWQPHIGDRVAFRGTRIVGDVKRIEGHDRVIFKVTAVQGKSGGSKMARAWKGAWVTCTPDRLAPLPS